MNNEEKCALYLRKKDIRRFMLGARKRYESYGRITGTVTVKNATDSEKSDMSGILARMISGPDIRVSLKEFVSSLQETSFGEVNFLEVMNCYFEEVIQTTKEKAEGKRKADEDFYRSLEAVLKKKNAGTYVYDWLNRMIHEKDSGYRILTKIRMENEEEAMRLFSRIADGINRVMKEETAGEEIAVFASAISGNPHFLDRGSDGANLFVSFLCFFFETEFPKDTVSWYELFETAGLIKDEIAGSIAIYNLHLIRNKELDRASEGSYSYQEPFMLTAGTLKHITSVQADNNCAYIVENEMVFTSLLKEVKDRNITLICTSGQLSVTAQLLIHKMAENGIRIYYSGDLDPEGISICERLYEKYLDDIIPWRMDVTSYQACISEEVISESRLSLLKSVQHPILKETAIKMQSSQRAGYQENILGLYLEDMLNIS